MKIDLRELAEKLNERNLTSYDIDSERLEQFVYEYLGDRGLFDRLYDELVDLELEKRSDGNNTSID